MNVVTSNTVPQPRAQGTEGIVRLTIPTGHGLTQTFELTAVVADVLGEDLMSAAAIARAEFREASR